MNIVEKIAKEEAEIYCRAHKRWTTSPYTCNVNLRLPGRSRYTDQFNHFLNYIGHGWNAPDRQKMLLNLELKSLKQYHIITEKERRRYAKMVRAGNEMADLAGVVINVYRDKRIKKYGWANVKL